jgi:hypothetical protein
LPLLVVTDYYNLDQNYLKENSPFLDESTPAVGTRKKLSNFAYQYSLQCVLVLMLNDVSMTCSVTSVIDDTMTYSFRFVEDVFLGSCGEIERGTLRSSPIGGDHGRALADAGQRPAPLPHHVPSCLGLPAAWTKS